MTHITQEEIIKIAHISYITLLDQEIEPLQTQLENILSYAERVAQLVSDSYDLSTYNVNVFRQDIAFNFDVQCLLAQAPDVAGNYFVVPIVLENT